MGGIGTHAGTGRRRAKDLLIEPKALLAVPGSFLLFSGSTLGQVNTVPIPAR